jgi:hypothetical protein
MPKGEADCKGICTKGTFDSLTIVGRGYQIPFIHFKTSKLWDFNFRSVGRPSCFATMGLEGSNHQKWSNADLPLLSHLV